MFKVKATASSTLAKDLDAELARIKMTVDQYLNRVALRVCNEAKRTSRFKNHTWNLRNSIRKRKSKFEGGGYIVIASGGKGFKGYHAYLVEEGHKLVAWGHPTSFKVKGRKFMRDAVAEGDKKARQIFGAK